jgi:hypothetical protein
LAYDISTFYIIWILYYTTCGYLLKIFLYHNCGLKIRKNKIIHNNIFNYYVDILSHNINYKTDIRKNIMDVWNMELYWFDLMVFSYNVFS